MFVAFLVNMAGMTLLLAASAAAQPRLTSPKEHFGFNIGDDYQLVNYTDYETNTLRLFRIDLSGGRVTALPAPPDWCRGQTIGSSRTCRCMSKPSPSKPHRPGCAT